MAGRSRSFRFAGSRSGAGGPAIFRIERGLAGDQRYGARPDEDKAELSSSYGGEGTSTQLLAQPSANRMGAGIGGMVARMGNPGSRGAAGRWMWRVMFTARSGGDAERDEGPVRIFARGTVQRFARQWTLTNSMRRGWCAT